MSNRADLRPALAAGAVLAVLAGSYGAAARWPARPVAATEAAPAEAGEATPAEPTSAATDPASPGAPAAPAAPEPEPESDEPDCPPQPIRFVRTRPAPVPHRYQGTVGGEPATAELRWLRPDSVTGSFYQWRQGPEYQLVHYGAGRSPFVFTLSHEYPDHTGADGTWQLAALPGPVLRGVWVDRAGRRQPVELHESYTGAVRYEIQALALTGGLPESGGIAGFGCAVPSYRREYLHLLPPPGASPALRHLQAPPLAVRRRQLRAEYGHDGEAFRSVQVRLNGFGLLSYATYDYEMPFGGRSGDEVLGTLLDLRTGRPLALTSQLLPTHRLALRRLIARHLLHDANFDFVNKDHDFRWQWEEEPRTPGAAADTTFSSSLWTQRALAPLTNEAVLTTEGLELTYWMGGLSDAGSVCPDQTVLLPYAELRPLVRPGTPLAGMLAARGLW